MGDGRAALAAEDAVHGLAGGAHAGPALGGAGDGHLVLLEDSDEGWAVLAGFGEGCSRWRAGLTVGRAALALAVIAVVYSLLSVLAVSVESGEEERGEEGRATVAGDERRVLVDGVLHLAAEAVTRESHCRGDSVAYRSSRRVSGGLEASRPSFELVRGEMRVKATCGWARTLLIRPEKSPAFVIHLTQRRLDGELPPVSRSGPPSGVGQRLAGQEL